MRAPIEITAALLAATNRITHADYPNEWSDEQKFRAFNEDAQLLASSIALAWARGGK